VFKKSQEFGKEEVIRLKDDNKNIKDLGLQFFTKLKKIKRYLKN